MALSQQQIDGFQSDGFLVLRRRVAPAVCEQMLAVARAHLRDKVAPIEYESDVGYPGAPPTRDAPGGTTVRRLRQAYQRHLCFRGWAEDAALVRLLAQLLGETVCLSLAHHNCVMTKHPHYGSATGWHRDIRYWSFTRPDLISVWLALGTETEANGALKFIPGSHRMNIGPAQLDERDFLRPDVAQNQPIVAKGIVLDLQPGDVVLFHSGLFHAAGRNITPDIKYSVVFAYRGSTNLPRAGTKSAATTDVFLGPAGAGG
jgi:phytanoyl-CoA hydroxylase